MHLFFFRLRFPRLFGIFCLNNHVFHVYLSIEEKNRRKLPLFSPILFIHNLINIDVFDFSFMIFNPFSSIRIDECLELSNTIMIVRWINMMVIITFMHNHTNHSILTGWLGVSQRLKTEIVEDIFFLQNAVEIQISNLSVSILLNVYIKLIITGNFLSKLSITWVCIIRIEHLMSLISSQL